MNNRTQLYPVEQKSITRIAHRFAIRGPAVLTAQAISLCFACGKTSRLFYFLMHLQALPSK